MMILTLGISLSFVQNIFADETSELILMLLLKKGVVTQSEVDELTKEAEKIKAGLPDTEDLKRQTKKFSWAERIKIKGDVRLRSDYQRPRESGDTPYTFRQRIRARAGLEAEITDTVRGGIGIATGAATDTSGRSRNQDLQRVFSIKAFDLDMAYIDWKPYEWVNFTGGKYKNPLYHPGDLIWDSDLNFEGASTNIRYRLLEDGDMPLDLMINAGGFLLDDLAVDRKNSWLGAAQVGLGTSLGEHVDAKGYFGLLGFGHIKNSKSTVLVPAAADRNAEGSYLHGYNVIEVSGDLTFHTLEGIMPGPLAVPVAFFGDYIINTEPSGYDKEQGYQLGIKLGKNEYKKFGDWRSVYSFRRLDRNAFPEQFPDADAFRGRSEGYGHEVIFAFGLAKNVWLEFDYYAFRDKTRGTDPIDNDDWGHIFQSDLNIKF
ncbi:MAG: putative porin [Candidatus Omnitrophota bacterium]